jgi:hypothetical protein
VKVFKNKVAFGGLAAPPGCNRGEQKIFSEEVAAEAREEGFVGWGFNEAAAESVGDDDVAGADGTEETGDAEEGVAPEFEGVAEVVILAAKDEVDG